MTCRSRTPREPTQCPCWANLRGRGRGGGRVRLRYGRVGLGWKQDKSRIRVGLSQGSNNEGFK